MNLVLSSLKVNEKVIFFLEFCFFFCFLVSC